MAFVVGVRVGSPWILPSVCRARVFLRPAVVSLIENGSSETAKDRTTPLAQTLRGLRRLMRTEVDLALLVERYNLRGWEPRGDDFVGCCPFHNDQTPSFYVYASTNRFYCFGCNATGDAVDFVARMEGISTTEAAMNLAKRAGLKDDVVRSIGGGSPGVQGVLDTIVDDRSAEKELRASLARVLKRASKFYVECLRMDVAGSHAREYLKDSRRLSTETIEFFQLGYAPNQWDALCQSSEVNESPPDRKVMEEAGLVKSSQSREGSFDFFRGRIMIPIRVPPRGDVVGFGGRVLDLTGPASLASKSKYINSPENALFKKSDVLFGAYEASKSPLKSRTYMVIVEGYFEVLSLHQAGFTNVVATLGTALKEGQVLHAARLSTESRVVLNFDSDQAGVAAVSRVVRDLAPKLKDVDLRVCFLPKPFKDADEFLVAQTIDHYRDMVARAEPWIQWAGGQIVEKLRDDPTVEGVSDAIEGFAELLAKALQGKDKDEHKRFLYAKKFAQLLEQENIGLGIAQVEYAILGAVGRRLMPAKSRNPRPSFVDRYVKGETLEFSLPERTVERARLHQMRAESMLLASLIHCPAYRVYGTERLIERKISFCVRVHAWLAEQICDPANQDLSPVELEAAVRQSFEKFVDSLDGNDRDRWFNRFLTLFDRKKHFPFEIRKPFHVFELALATAERYAAEVSQIRALNRIKDQMTRSLDVESQLESLTEASEIPSASDKISTLKKQQATLQKEAEATWNQMLDYVELIRAADEHRKYIEVEMVDDFD